MAKKKSKLKDELTHLLECAMNERALQGYAFGRDYFGKEVSELLESHGVDIDDVVSRIEENEDGEFDLY